MARCGNYRARGLVILSLQDPDDINLELAAPADSAEPVSARSGRRACASRTESAGRIDLETAEQACGN